MPFKDKNKSRKYHREYNKEYFKKYPWRLTLENIKTRCGNTKHQSYEYYGSRGIKCLITEEELKFLWFRDKAYEMDKPSIDREDNDGNYTLKNCRFIELVDNVIKSNKESNIKGIVQYDLNGNFIREFISIMEAEYKTKIDHRQICNHLKGRQKSCHGFIFKYISD